MDKSTKNSVLLNNTNNNKTPTQKGNTTDLYSFWVELEGETDWQKRLITVENWIKRFNDSPTPENQFKLEKWSENPLKWLPRAADAWRECIKIIEKNEFLINKISNWFCVFQRNSWEFYTRELECALWETVKSTSWSKYDAFNKEISNIHEFFFNPIENEALLWKALNNQKISNSSQKIFIRLIHGIDSLPSQDNFKKFSRAAVWMAFHPDKISLADFKVWWAHSRHKYSDLLDSQIRRVNFLSPSQKTDLILSKSWDKQSLPYKDLTKALEYIPANKSWLAKALQKIVLAENDTTELGKSPMEIQEQKAWVKAQNITVNCDHLLWTFFTSNEKKTLQSIFKFAFDNHVKSLSTEKHWYLKDLNFVLVPEKGYFELKELLVSILPNSNLPLIEHCFLFHKKYASVTSDNIFEALFKFLEWFFDVDYWKYNPKLLREAHVPVETFESLPNISNSIYRLLIRAAFLTCPQSYTIIRCSKSFPQEIRDQIRLWAIDPKLDHFRRLKGYNLK